MSSDREPIAHSEGGENGANGIKRDGRIEMSKAHGTDEYPNGYGYSERCSGEDGVFIAETHMIRRTPPLKPSPCHSLQLSRLFVRKCRHRSHESYSWVHRASALCGPATFSNGGPGRLCSGAASTTRDSEARLPRRESASMALIFPRFYGHVERRDYCSVSLAEFFGFESRN